MGVPRHLPTIRAVIAEARANLSPRLWDYVEGGASGEASLVRNRGAFDLWSFDPDMLVGLSRPRTESQILGIPVTMPVFASPFGYDKALHPAGYAAVARAIGEAGITSIVSESSSDSLVDLAPEFSGQQGGVQVTLVAEDEHVLGFEQRAKDAGYRFLCLTDGPTRAWRERMRENGLDLNRFYGQGNYGPGGASRHALDELMNFTQPRWDWSRLDSLASKMTLPWVLKGIVSAKQARRALDAGASGIYMSCYGGRNLDGTMVPLQRLEEVREEVGDSVPILIDSGFRHGTDVAKALALGADAVGVGRLMAFGLAAGSYEDPSLGVRKVLEHLHDELETVMGSLGCQTVADIERRHVVAAALSWPTRRWEDHESIRAV